jgi:hypothetical protein
MTERTVLIKEINKLPPKYYGEVFDFVEYLQKKGQIEYENDVVGYKAMAADTEREQEAQEWCNACFGPV